MDWHEFNKSLREDAPPSGMPPLLKAMWWEGKGDWSRAHEIAQEDDGSNGAWVHAYLHRREGDSWNAEYWYRRARREPSTLPLEDEWREIAVVLLDPLT